MFHPLTLIAASSLKITVQNLLKVINFFNSSCMSNDKKVQENFKRTLHPSCFLPTMKMNNAKNQIFVERKNSTEAFHFASFFRDKLKFFSHECWNISYLLILCKANFHFAGHGNKMPLYPMVNRFFLYLEMWCGKSVSVLAFGNIKFDPLTSANLIIAFRFNHMKNYNVNSFVDTPWQKKPLCITFFTINHQNLFVST